MIYAVLVPSLLLGVAVVGGETQEAANSSNPHLHDSEGLEAAPYTVVAQHEGFEERQYPARRWATVSAAGEDMDGLMDTMFLRLFRYISGQNQKGATVAMTTPVSTLVRPQEEGASASFTMAFLVPEAHQAEPPQAEGVAIEDRPQMTVFTRRFGGFANETVIGEQANELAELLSAANVTDVDLQTYYVAGYDGPRKLEGRRNEVWFFRVHPAAGEA